MSSSVLMEGVKQQPQEKRMFIIVLLWCFLLLSSQRKRIKLVRTRWDVPAVKLAYTVMPVWQTEYG